MGYPPPITQSSIAKKSICLFLLYFLVSAAWSPGIVSQLWLIVHLAWLLVDGRKSQGPYEISVSDHVFLRNIDNSSNVVIDGHVLVRWQNSEIVCLHLNVIFQKPQKKKCRRYNIWLFTVHTSNSLSLTDTTPPRKQVTTNNMVRNSIFAIVSTVQVQVDT